MRIGILGSGLMGGKLGTMVEWLERVADEQYRTAPGGG